MHSRGAPRSRSGSRNQVTCGSTVRKLLANATDPCCCEGTTPASPVHVASTSTRDITMICRLCSDTMPWGASCIACWQLKGSLVFDALTTEQGLSMLYNLSSTLFVIRYAKLISQGYTRPLPAIAVRTCIHNMFRTSLASQPTLILSTDRFQYRHFSACCTLISDRRCGN